MPVRIEDQDCPLKYISKIRYYTMSAPKKLLKKNEIGPGYAVLFCTYCGTKLPQNLAEEWADILEQEYEITDPSESKQKNLIPAEFKTDEWWKKRGL